MVVAVVFVRMVEVAIHEVIDVVAVGHRFVAAAGAVDVAGFVAAAGVGGRAGVGVGGGHFDDVLVEVVAVGRVEVAVVEVVHVVAVLDGNVSAAFAMDMGMVGMNAMFAHQDRPFREVGGTTGAAGAAGVSLACASALKTRSRMCWSASE